MPRGLRRREVLQRSAIGLAIVILVASVAKLVLRSSGTARPPTACIDAGGGIDQIGALGRRLGRPITCAMVFANATSSWDQWTHPWFLSTHVAAARWADWMHDGAGRRRLIITLGMVPSSAPPDWRTRGAEGAYDGYAQTLGRELVAAGLGHSVLRIGPEANYQSGVNSAGPTPLARAEWSWYWARLAMTLKGVAGAHFTLDWTVNAAVRAIPFAQYYPGSSAVDVIGVDTYDALADGRRIPDGAVRWQALRSQPYGLDAVIAFARMEHKPLSVPEWGDVGSPVASGGGDDPYYVAAMVQLFKDQGVSYECYFDKAVGGTIRLEDAPQSLAVYQVATEVAS